MANPQPDHYTKLNNELYEAIMQTDFSKRQRNILDLVIRMSYGCGKKVALLRPSDFELVGVLRTHIKKELDYLSEVKVLLIDGEQIQINKNYDQWRVSLVKRFSKQKYMELLKRNLPSGPVTKTVTSEGDFDSQKSNASYQNGNSLVYESYQNSNTSVTILVTDTSDDPNSTNGFKPPKENNKENNNNDDDRWSDLSQSEPSKEDRQAQQIERYYLKKKQRKAPLSAKDYQAIDELVTKQVPLDRIKKAVDHAFEIKGVDGVHSFNYCATILWNWINEEKRRDQHHAKNNQRYGSNQRENPANESITGGKVGWLNMPKWLEEKPAHLSMH
ncbi:replication protein [Thermoflavimicrobium daqui]|uniref:Uncharacterized protein n=1 Tax=Thermoflavimicrobium daqui TaxID=2137476 RepID=A0A364K8V4_9BACL|nr:replication protein [Thermoflavimicrobium daqui]RAL26729.1 hypothetical protein DL897_01370 [Thermoflavimicrobium daqui]